MYTNTYNLIKEGLNAATMRSEVISNNIANVNTNNYKRSEVLFEEMFKETKIETKTTNSKHISSNINKMEIREDDSTSMRTDGNNVDIDLEMIDQAANTLAYNALITSMKSKLNLTSYIISGGN